MVLKERSNIDITLRDLIGEHLSRDLATPAGAIASEEPRIVPAGMTVEEEAELVTLLSLADANLDGDEQAAIDRLVAALDAARSGAR